MPFILGAGAGGGVEKLTIDPVAVDATNVPLELINRGGGFDVLEETWAPPDLNAIYASSIDTEGGFPVAQAYANRTVTVKVRCFDIVAGDGNMLLALKKLQQKVGKLQNEGGTIARTLTNGQVVNFTVTREVRLTVPADYLFFRSSPGPTASCDLELVCLPLGFGAAVQLADHVETTLPVLRFTESAITGDVPALAQGLLIDEDQGATQLHVRWGMRWRTYGTAATEALFYEAEGRLPQGGAALATRSGASGGTVVRQGTLTASWQSMMSLASSGTAYCSHRGDYSVVARVFDPGATVGATQLALEWSQGDFVNVTRNDPVAAPVVGDFSLVDLGQVHIGTVLSGTQRWDGRVIVSNTIGGTIDVDCLMLFPLEQSGQATASAEVGAVTTLTGRDEFTGTTAGGALNARVAPLGGTWATSGATTDFTFSDNAFSTGSEEITRSTSSDSGAGRFAILGSTVTDCEVTVLVYEAISGAGQRGLVARWIDASNYLTAYYDTGNKQLALDLVVAGVTTNLGTIDTVDLVGVVKYEIRLIAYASGLVIAQALDLNGAILETLKKSSTVIATGGTLASGKPGIRDKATGAATRYYDNFYTGTPSPADAICYPSRSLELRSDRVRRQDSTGTAWGNLDGRYEGNYPKVPPAGQEARTVEFIIKMSRGDPTSTADSAIDDLSARLTIVPRYLVVPET